MTQEGPPDPDALLVVEKRPPYLRGDPGLLRTKNGIWWFVYQDGVVISQLGGARGKIRGRRGEERVEVEK